MICWTCQKYVGSFTCLNQFHLGGHPHKNRFTEENLQSYYLQVNALLHKLSKKITGTEDPKQLLQHVQKNKLYPMPNPQRIPFTVFEIALLRGLQELVVSLLHWCILVLLFLQLDPQACLDLNSFDVQKLFLKSVQKFQNFTDSHFHRDKLLENFKAKDLRDVATKVNESLKTLELAIINYVYLEKWDQIHHESCLESRVHYTIGVHTHRIFNHDKFPVKPIIDELQNVKCVGVCKIGLDHTTKCKCKEHQTYHQKSNCRPDKIAAQNPFLDKMLHALKDIDTVIVIHSQGEDAAEIIRQKLIHFNLCERRIHCHCFTGDKQEAILWMSTFKHVKFNISSKLLNSPELKESVQAIPSNKLLLESDSPYLSSNWKLNHPWNIKHYAELLASLKNLPLSLLTQITSINTRMLYQITQQYEEISPVSVPHQMHQSTNLREHILFNGPTTPFSNFFPCKL